MGAASGGERQRDEREAGRERTAAECELQVEGAEQEQPEHETGVDQGQQEATADGPVAEPVDAQERLGGAEARSTAKAAEAGDADAADAERLPGDIQPAESAWVIA